MSVFGKRLAQLRKEQKLSQTELATQLGENENADLLKDPEMVNRFKEILALKNKEREHVLFALYAMIRDVKLKELAGV